MYINFPVLMHIFDLSRRRWLTREGRLSPEWLRGSASRRGSTVRHVTHTESHDSHALGGLGRLYETVISPEESAFRVVDTFYHELRRKFESRLA